MTLQDTWTCNFRLGNVRTRSCHLAGEKGFMALPVINGVLQVKIDN